MSERVVAASTEFEGHGVLLSPMVFGMSDVWGISEKSDH
jgi:hypothetical protein